MHEGSILTDIAWIMVGAMIAALIFQRLRLPPLLGYLIAGFFLGPHLGLWPALVEVENVQELSELGVIFLMFYIGLEFDLEESEQDGIAVAWHTGDEVVCARFGPPRRDVGTSVAARAAFVAGASAPPPACPLP